MENGKWLNGKKLLKKKLTEWILGSDWIIRSDQMDKWLYWPGWNQAPNGLDNKKWPNGQVTEWTSDQIDKWLNGQVTVLTGSEPSGGRWLFCSRSVCALWTAVRLVSMLLSSALCACSSPCSSTFWPCTRTTNTFTSVLDCDRTINYSLVIFVSWIYVFSSDNTKYLLLPFNSHVIINMTLMCYYMQVLKFCWNCLYIKHQCFINGFLKWKL